MPQNLFHVEQFKAEAPSEQAQLVPAKNILRSFPLCSGETGIRRAGEKALFAFFRGGLCLESQGAATRQAYDPEPLGAVARHFSN